jgi:autoinducer 2-degrading protein
MHIVIVDIHVLPERLEEFKAATLENAASSLQEPGVARFDFLQQGDDPTHFVLFEAYYQPEDQQKHRETAHYQAWRDRVASMMAAPRVGTRYVNLFPPDHQWG